MSGRGPLAEFNLGSQKTFKKQTDWHTRFYGHAGLSHLKCQEENFIFFGVGGDLLNYCLDETFYFRRLLFGFVCGSDRVLLR